MGKLFALFFAIVSIVLLYAAFYQFHISQRTMSTEGEIKKINIRLGVDRDSTISSGRAYFVDVEYRYSVNDKVFYGTQLRIDGNAYVLKKNADKIVGTLRKNSKATVWFDPLQPSRSFLLKPGVQTKTVVAFFVCGFLSYVSYGYLDKVILYLGRFKKL